jgi:hypothetical protein
MENLTPLSIIGSALAFLFGVWKYLDTRKLEAKNKRFEQFRQVFIWFAGRDENGQVLTAVQQAVATYQLAEFPEYKHLSLPVIDHLLQVTASESPPSLFRQALQQVKQQLAG